MTTKLRPIGRGGKPLCALGLGCMGMSDFYGHRDDTESMATLHRALELGVDHFDTSDFYGPFLNEELLGRFLREASRRPFLATKFGVVSETAPDGTRTRRFVGTPEHVRSACEASLKRLGVEVIDLYYYHRVDRTVPIEETIGAMADLVRRGLVRSLGLSEVSVPTLRRAHAVHPIAALQSEYSLFTRDVEKEILPTCRELGITLVAYSPLGRGFLTGAFQSAEQLDAGDWRRNAPRFQAENFGTNRALVAELEGMARAKGCQATQLALAWLLARGEDVVAIPGTKRRKYLEANMGALDVSLDAREVAAIDQMFAPERIGGKRYADADMKWVNV